MRKKIAKSHQWKAPKKCSLFKWQKKYIHDFPFFASIAAVKHKKNYEKWIFYYFSGFDE